MDSDLQLNIVKNQCGQKIIMVHWHTIDTPHNWYPTSEDQDVRPVDLEGITVLG